MGRALRDVPAESWLAVQTEKSPDMIHVLDFPYNGEPPRVSFSYPFHPSHNISHELNDNVVQDRLVSTPLTRNEDHFVRNHGGVPNIDEDDFYFDVGGLVNNPKRITMKELKDEKIFPRQSTIVTLQCSGTRRIEQIHQYPGDGDEMINAPVSPPHPIPPHLINANHTPDLSGAKAPSAQPNGPASP